MARGAYASYKLVRISGEAGDRDSLHIHFFTGESTVIYICNAISLGMLSGDVQSASLQLTEIADPREFLRDVGARFGQVVSAVGHADTAALFATLLDRPVAPARVTLQFSPYDVYLVGQLAGPRLPEGATTLPEGASIRWILVAFHAGR